MFESMLRITVSTIVIGTFLWLMREVSLRFSVGRFSVAKVVLSFGSMLLSMSILAYIMAPIRDAYLQTAMELCLIVGAGCLGFGVIMLPVVKWWRMRHGDNS